MDKKRPGRPGAEAVRSAAYFLSSVLTWAWCEVVGWFDESKV